MYICVKEYLTSNADGWHIGQGTEVQTLEAEPRTMAIAESLSNVPYYNG
jgi:hypothetical protein